LAKLKLGNPPDSEAPGAIVFWLSALRGFQQFMAKKPWRQSDGKKVGFIGIPDPKTAIVLAAFFDQRYAGLVEHVIQKGSVPNKRRAAFRRVAPTAA